jgi:aerobic carbon-monoxide dehydrogenase large subunit
VPARALSWSELAGYAAESGRSAELSVEDVFDQGEPTFPFGAHIAAVEVDLDTGATTVLRHVAVDDCGIVLNPMIVEGQQHGGVAAGIGQALYEEIRFDDAGNPLTSNLADYTVPSAAELPSFDARSTETATPLNPLGAKGIGEAATIGATPAVQNAVVDAVAHLGVRHIDLPCTPERVWRTVRDAQAGVLPDPWVDPPAVFETIRARRAGTMGEDRATPQAAESI